MENQMQRLSSPKKSPTDEKEYSVIRLPNGLTALIVSDVKNLKYFDTVRNISESKDDSVSADLNSLSLNDASKETNDLDAKDHSVSAVTGEDSNLDSVSGENSTEQLAGVALTVNVGSFSDPAEVPGLAHFLQHMLLLGSERYPNEDYFSGYLSTIGGRNSAFTKDERTTFYFECPETHLEEAIDIFSQCFISPVLKEAAMDRGWEAVESQFQDLRSDGHTPLHQFLSSLAAPDNPCSKFKCGSKETLKDNVPSHYLHSSTVAFWKRHYSAHRMNLAIKARLPSALVESWVVKYFSPIVSNNLPPDPFPMAGPSFVKEKFHKMYFVQSTRNGTYISIEWILPPVVKYYKGKPLKYLAWIMNHGGTNSLIHFLKSNNWVSDAHTDVVYNSLYTIFEISVILARSGVDEVVAAVFAFLKLLQEQGPNERIFEEISSLAEIDFRFQKKQDAVSHVIHLSQAMLKYPPEDYLCSSAKYDPELIQSLLDQITPENACVIVHTNTVFVPDIFDKEEFWFKTKYREHEMEPELFEYFNNYELPQSVTLPPPNAFVPFKFDFIPSSESAQFPVKLDSGSDRFEIWHKQHSTEVPTTSACFHFITALTNSSARNSFTFIVYMHMLKLMLRPVFWPAYLCGYTLGFEKTERGFTLELGGYHEKLHLALELVLAQIKSFHADASPELFETIKEELSEEHRNSLMNGREVEECLRHSALLRNYCFLPIEHVAEFPQVQLEDVIELSKRLWQQLRVQCLFQGNLTAAQAKELCHQIESSLEFEVLPSGRIPRVMSCQLPLGKSACKVRSFSSTDTDCLTAEYYQCGVFDLKMSCTIQFFIGLIFRERLLNALQEDELWQAAASKCQNNNGMVGFWVMLGSAIDKLDPKLAAMEVSSLVQNLDQELKSVPEETFQQMQEYMIKSTSRCFDSLQDEVDFNFQEIVSQNFFFSRHHEETKHFKELKLSDLVEWYENYVKSDSGMLRKLTVQVVGHDPNSGSESPTEDSDEMPVDYAYIIEPELNPDYIIISDIKLFNNSLQTYEIT